MNADRAMRALVALGDDLGVTGAELVTLLNRHRLSIIAGRGDDGFGVDELRRIDAARSAVAAVLGGYEGMNATIRELAVMASSTDDLFND